MALQSQNTPRTTPSSKAPNRLENKIQNRFSARGSNELFGLLTVVFAIFLTVSLLSYHASDDSFLISSSAVVKNFGGKLGSYAADILLQYFGFASAIIVAIIMLWGVVMFLYGKLILLPVRIFMMMLSVACADLVFGFLKTQEFKHQMLPGGYLGFFLSSIISNTQYTKPIIFFCICFSGVAFFLSVGISYSKWHYITILVYKATRFLGKILLLKYINYVLLITLKAIGAVLRFLVYKPLKLIYMRFYFWFHVKLLGKQAKNDDVSDEEFIEKELYLSQLQQQDSSADEESCVQEQKAAIAESNVNRPAPQGNKPITIVDNTATRLSAASNFQPKQNSGPFVLPSVSLLKDYSQKNAGIGFNKQLLLEQASQLEKVLSDFGVKGKIVSMHHGPVVTLFQLQPEAGTKSSRVIGLADDVARSMSATSSRISVISGKDALGVELPNKDRQIVFLRELFETKDFQESSFFIPLVLGKNIAGEVIIVDLAKMPHLLIAGTTGSGKSVGINAMILSILYHYPPEDCRMIMIDPKMLELSVYDGIPHLLAPVVTDPKKAILSLRWVVKEMERRYKIMSSIGVRNIMGYNEKVEEALRKGDIIHKVIQTGYNEETGDPIIEKIPIETKRMPFIVVIVDEMADLMLTSGKEIEASIQRLAQMARAAGIHIVMATQRPSVDVITGVIKANFPTRISFQVTSKIDSRTILGEQGAEQLLGQGDMLYMSSGSKITRVHGPFVSDKEVEDVVNFLKSQSSPEYIAALNIQTADDEEDEDSDEYFEDNLEYGEKTDISGKDISLYEQAIKVVLQSGKVSTSFLQRKLRIGYNRAASFIDRMENEGLISSPSHTGKRMIIDENKPQTD